jgi:hypothetical protein
MAEEVIDKLDINSFDDNSVMDIDPNADYATLPPPPDDGKYRAIIKLKANKNGELFTGKRDESGNVKYLATQIEARIVNPGGKFDDWPIFDNFVSTMVGFNSNTSKIASLLKDLGKPLAGRVSHKDQVLALQAALEGGAEIGIVTQWRASATTGKKKDNGKDEYEELKGQKRFPEDGKGGRKHIVKLAGVEAQASAEIVRYVPVSEL